MRLFQVLKKLQFLLLISLSISCKNKNVILEPSDLTLNLQSTHYNYYYHIDDSFIADTLWMENHYTWVTTKLNLKPINVLNYYKYISRLHLERINGKTTNGFAEVGTWNFHSIWHPENHENVHTLVINEIGHPPALFNEGIAVAFAPQPIYGKGKFIDIPTWDGEPIDQIALSLRNSNQIPELETLLESTSFFEYDTNTTYPMSGSFIKYLLKNNSVSQLKAFFSGLPFTSSQEEVKNQFKIVYNRNIQEVWNEWLQQL